MVKLISTFPHTITYPNWQVFHRCLSYSQHISLCNIYYYCLHHYQSQEAHGTRIKPRIFLDNDYLETCSKSLLRNNAKTKMPQQLCSLNHHPTHTLNTTEEQATIKHPGAQYYNLVTPPCLQNEPKQPPSLELFNVEQWNCSLQIKAFNFILNSALAFSLCSYIWMGEG